MDARMFGAATDGNTLDACDGQIAIFTTRIAIFTTIKGSGHNDRQPKVTCKNALPY